MNPKFRPQSVTVEPTATGGRFTRLKRWTAVLTVALLAAGGALVATSPATADEVLTGQISGVALVQGEDGNYVVPGADEVSVTAWRLIPADGPDGVPDATPMATVDAPTNGAYTFGPLPVGSYAFEYNYSGPIGGVVSSFADGSMGIDEQLYNLFSFDAIGEGESRNLTDSLRQGAKISGTVSGTAGVLSGQPVDLWRRSSGASGYSQWISVRTLTTDSSGHYAADGLASGDYAWQAGGAGGYVREFYEDVVTNDPEDAEIEFANWGQEFVRDFSLAKGSAISGSVKSSSGAGLSGIVVSLNEYDGGMVGDFISSTVSTSSGSYKLPAVAAGTYTLSFESFDLATKPYLTEFWNNKPNHYDVTPLTVNGTSAKTGINAVLTKAAKITGTLALAGGGFPSEDDVNITACAFFAGDDYATCGVNLGSTYDETTGAYSLLGLRAGSYTVFAEHFAGNFRDEYYSDARTDSTATRFTVATGATVAGKNITLDFGSVLMGDVEDVLDTPVEGALIEVYHAVGNRADDDWGVLASTVTDEDGNYAISGLEPGSVAVYVTPPGETGLASQWYLGEGSPSHVTPVTLEIDEATDVDFTLVAAQGISGTVRNTDLAPVYDVQVGLYRFRSELSNSTEHVAGATTDAFGAYSFGALAPGHYVLKVGADWLGYVTTWDDAEPDEAIYNAHRIELTSSGVTRDVTVHRGASVSGRIVSTEGPVSDVGVRLSCSDNDQEQYVRISDGSGEFNFGAIEPADCSLSITPKTEGLVAETTVPLSGLTLDAPNQDLGNIMIDWASIVEGRVTGSDGKPLADVGIIPYLVGENGLPVSTGDFAVTDSQGYYALTGIPEGKIYLQFLPSSSKYSVQYLGGSPDWSQSEVVVVPEGEVVHRDVRLIDGGRVTGKITNSATGSGVKNILVQAWPLFSDGLNPAYAGGSALTNGDGNYTISGLPYGSYEIVVNYDYDVLATWQSYTYTEKTVNLPSRATKTVNAKITKTLKVTGTVRDETGLPLGDVRAEAIKLVGGEPVRDASNGSVSYTNQAGAYELRLEPGSWVIRFSDNDGLVAETYYGNVQDQDDAALVVLSKSNVSGKNVTMPKLTGGITAHLEADYETPSGYVTLARVDDEGDELWSRYLSNGWELGDVNDVFPITNLAPGTYKLTVDPTGGFGTYGASYTPVVIDDIEVIGNTVTDLGAIHVSGHQEISPSGFPMVDPLNPPTIGYCDLEVGSTLWAIDGAWNQTPIETAYQWLRDGAPIPGANEDTYRLAPGDAGHHIRLATGIRSQAYTWADPYAYVTDETAEVAPGDAPVPLTDPSISGKTSVGQTLKAVPGTWSLPGVEFSYRWIRSGDAIADTVVSTASSYKVTSADLWDVSTNIRLHLEVKAKHTGYEDGYGWANAPTVVPASSPLVLTKGKVSSTAPGEYKVTAGSWSVSGLTYRYLWITRFADGSSSVFEDDEHGTSATYISAEDDLLEVKVLASKPGYATSAFVLTVRTGPQIEFDGSAQLLAVPQVGLPVSVDLSAVVFSVAEPTLSYQWYRNGTAITGAKSASYTPSLTDVAKTLSVKVIASKTGYPSSLAAIATASATTLAPGFMIPDEVTISGDPTVGRTLTVVLGTWSPVPTSFTYQWKRDGINITGATAKTYLVSSKDLGKSIGVTVIGKRAGFFDVGTNGEPTNVVTTRALQNTVAPAISPVVKVGTKITAGTGKWDLTPSSFEYQWMLNGVPIWGATSSSYTPTPSDFGQELCVEVTAKRSGYENSAGVCSNDAFVDKGAAVSATGKPVLKVNGTAVTKTLLGKVVTTNAGTWPVSGLAFSYQWQVLVGSDWMDIEGETHEGIGLDGSVEEVFAVGRSYRVVVDASRSGYLPSQTISAPVLVTG